MSEQMLQKFYDDDDRLVALVISYRFKKEGVEFFTPTDFSQQLGYLHHKKGTVIQPHVHKKIKRDVYLTQEVLFVRKGRVKVDLYSAKHTFLTSTVIETGDVILLASGGHGFTMLEPTEMIEVKQGPYLGDHDKTLFLSLRVIARTA